MRLRFWDRILAALYVLLSLGLSVLVALRSIGMDFIGRFYEDIRQITLYWYLIFYGLLAIIVLLGFYMLKLVFARRPKRSAFVTVDSGDNGKVVIAVSAIEEMVRHAARSAEGVADMKIAVHGEEDSISLLIELTVAGGAHLPAVTANLQRNIRRYVEMNCGVAVRDVTVTVGAVLPPKDGLDSFQSGDASGRIPERNWREDTIPPGSVTPAESFTAPEEPSPEEEVSLPGETAEDTPAEAPFSETDDTNRAEE